MKHDAKNEAKNEVETVDETKTVDAPPVAAGRMPSDEEVGSIIKNRVYASMAAGVVPVPFFNFAAESAIQIEMVRAVAKAYGVTFKESWVKNIISSVVGGAASTMISKPLSEAFLIGVPVVGLPLAVLTQPAMNGITTYAIGHMFARHFAAGGNLEDADSEGMTKRFKDGVKEARQWVGERIAGGKAAPETAG